jgi:hypothetical protein
MLIPGWTADELYKKGHEMSRKMGAKGIRLGGWAHPGNNGFVLAWSILACLLISLTQETHCRQTA